MSFDSRTPTYVHSKSDLENFMKRNLTREIVVCFVSQMSQDSVNFYNDMYVDKTIRQTPNRVCALIDIDASPAFAALFNISTAPVFIFYRVVNGSIIQLKKHDSYNRLTFV